MWPWEPLRLTLSWDRVPSSTHLLWRQSTTHHPLLSRRQSTTSHPLLPGRQSTTCQPLLPGRQSTTHHLPPPQEKEYQRLPPPPQASKLALAKQATKPKEGSVCVHKCWVSGDGDVWWAKRAAGRREWAAVPRTRVSFRVLLSRDFSWLPQMASFLAG